MCQTLLTMNTNLFLLFCWLEGGRGKILFYVVFWGVGAGGRLGSQASQDVQKLTKRGCCNFRWFLIGQIAMQCILDELQAMDHLWGSLRILPARLSTVVTCIQTINNQNNLQFLGNLLHEGVIRVIRGCIFLKPFCLFLHGFFYL